MKRLLVVFFVTATCSFAADFAVPPEGNVLGGNSLPFLYTSMRYQQVYGATAFSSLTPVGGGWITAIQFRQITGDYIAGFSAAELEMRLSTTSRPVDGLSTTFSENIGSDEAVVRRGVIDLQPGADGPLGLAAPYIPLATPFFYNPAAGSLLLDVTMFRMASQGFDPVGFDESDRSTDQSSRVFAFDRAALTGRADTDALITGFRVTPIPEPGPAALLFVGLAVASVFGVRRKNNTTTQERNDPWHSQ